MIDVELSMRDTHVWHHARINTIYDVHSGHQNARRQEYIIWKLQNDHNGDRKHSRDDWTQ